MAAAPFPAGGIVMDAALADERLPERLRAAKGVLEIREPDGTLLGQFVPAPPPEVRVLLDPLPSREELARRVRESKSYTPEQVLERLQQLRGPRDAN